MLRKKVMAIALGAMTLWPMGASATTLNPGDVVNMVGSYDFTRTFVQADGAGSFNFTFVNTNSASSNVIISDATVTALNLAFGNKNTGLPGVVFSWASSGTFFSTFTTGSIANFMHTIAASASDVLTITYGDPTVRNKRPANSTGTITLSTTALPVPLPAGGFLLLGALAGLTVLRRRKSV